MFNVHLYSAVIQVDSHMLTALGEDDGEKVGERELGGDRTGSRGMQEGLWEIKSGNGHEESGG